MASSIIHYTISKKILEHIPIHNADRFLLGASIAPDASSHEDGSYDKSHFWERFANEPLTGINWDNFVNEYREDFWKDDVYLGYYCHLIQDAVWFHDIVDKYIRIYPKDIKALKHQMGYRDYKRLNYLLIKEYNLLPFKNVNLQIPIKEVTEARIIKSFETFEQWFQAEKCTKTDLELYSWDIIDDYINKSVSVCVSQIEALKNGVKGSDPKDYYVLKLEYKPLHK